MCETQAIKPCHYRDQRQSEASPPPRRDHGTYSSGRSNSARIGSGESRARVATAPGSPVSCGPTAKRSSRCPDRTGGSAATAVSPTPLMPRSPPVTCWPVRFRGRPLAGSVHDSVHRGLSQRSTRPLTNPAAAGVRSSVTTDSIRTTRAWFVATVRLSLGSPTLRGQRPGSAGA